MSDLLGQWAELLSWHWPSTVGHYSRVIGEPDGAITLHLSAASAEMALRILQAHVSRQALHVVVQVDEPNGFVGFVASSFDLPLAGTVCVGESLGDVLDAVRDKYIDAQVRW